MKNSMNLSRFPSSVESLISMRFRQLNSLMVQNAHDMNELSRLRKKTKPVFRANLAASLVEFGTRSQAAKCLAVLGRLSSMKTSGALNEAVDWANERKAFHDSLRRNGIDYCYTVKSTMRVIFFGFGGPTILSNKPDNINFETPIGVRVSEFISYMKDLFPEADAEGFVNILVRHVSKDFADMMERMNLNKDDHCKFKSRLVEFHKNWHK